MLGGKYVPPPRLSDFCVSPRLVSRNTPGPWTAPAWRGPSPRMASPPCSDTRPRVAEALVGRKDRGNWKRNSPSPRRRTAEALGARRRGWREEPRGRYRRRRRTRDLPCTARGRGRTAWRGTRCSRGLCGAPRPDAGSRSGRVTSAATLFATTGPPSTAIPAPTSRCVSRGSFHRTTALCEGETVVLTLCFP